MNLSAALYDILTRDTELVNMLSTYKGKPAVFTITPVPPDAVLPYVVTATTVAQTPFDTKTSQGRTIWRDIKIYADAKGSAIDIDEIAERVYYILHRNLVVVPGYAWILTECQGPASIDEDYTYGRLITARILLERFYGGS